MLVGTDGKTSGVQPLGAAAFFWSVIVPTVGGLSTQIENPPHAELQSHQTCK